jgi:hypothetical protein
MKAVAQGWKFRVLPGSFAVCRLKPDDPVPAWASGKFFNLTRTAEELAIICASDQVPAEICAERNWRVLKLVGPFPFTATGVLAAIAAPLARAKISLLSIATYDTDYFLIKEEAFEQALAVLARAGHARVRGASVD